MDIEDFSWNDIVSKRQNNPLFPKSIKGLIIGRSGCGKTTLLINLLINPGWLDYDNLMIFGNSLFQPEYRLLKKAFEEKLPKERISQLFNARDLVLNEAVSSESLIEKWSKTLANKSDIRCSFFESPDDVPDPKKLNLKDKNLMIFDDFLLEKQNKCESYYMRGRHSNADCFYLSQSFFELRRRTIRGNANFMCIFEQDDTNVVNIYKQHASIDMNIDEFRNFCKKVWEKPYGFIVIDLSSKKDEGRYRDGLDNFYIPSK